MPKSDTWPGGIGLETMNGMDSAGSCDSVVSANSGFSDDSLEHLSAEEKACIMFLEETIESLDTEEDSGLSNDEPDQLPNPGNLANKLADLSANMSKSKFNSPQKNHSNEQIMVNADSKPLQSYLIPTPLVVASSGTLPVPKANPGIPPDKNFSSTRHFTPSSKELGHKDNQKYVAPQVPLEVHVLIPAPTQPRDYSVRTVECPLPRGPLSYDALVHLRRSASTKKTPLCPTIDHTIDSGKRLPVTVEEPKPRFDRSHSEASLSKSGPPVVPPKPKKIPAVISGKKLNEPAVPESSYRIKHAADPQVIRLEALEKLGLLKDEEPENETVAPLPAPKSHSFLAPKPNGITRGPSNMNPSRSPSFSYSQVPSEPKNRHLQSSASFHHYSRPDQQPTSGSHFAQSNGMKAAGLDSSATLNKQRNGCPEPQQPVKPTAQPVAQKPSNAVAYTVMVVPGMGADRREALRKLGLLKD